VLLGKNIRGLREAGYTVERAGTLCPSAPDEEVSALAFAKGWELLTEDHDFGELWVRLRMPSHGVLVASVKKLPATARGAWVVQCLNQLGDDILGSFVTIEPGRMRRRPL
jgi:predicted nuclease of predicted toxin-antitoxin system